MAGTGLLVDGYGPFDVVHWLQRFGHCAFFWGPINWFPKVVRPAQVNPVAIYRMT